MRWLAAWLRDITVSLRGFDWSELRYVSACGNWPVAVHIVICIASVLLVLLLCCLALLPGFSTSWQSAREYAGALENERIALQQRLVVMSARNISVASRCLPCRALHRRLRPADAMPVVLDRLSGVATAQDVRVAALRPEKFWQHASLNAFEVSVQLHADQPQLAAFLTRIGSLPFALAMKQVDWQLASARADLTLMLLVDESGEVDETRDRDSTTSDPVAPDPVFGGFDVGRWQRVALIQRGDRYLEVLRDARGDILRRTGETDEVVQ